MDEEKIEVGEEEVASLIAGEEPEAVEEAPEVETTEEKPQEETPQEEETKEEPKAEGSELEGLQKAFEQYRQQAIEMLAKDVYALSPEEVQQLEEDPGSFLAQRIPQVLARVHIEAQQAALVQMARVIPQVMAQVHQEMEKARSFEEKFFSRWPQLREHKDEVLKIGQVFRQLNPQAKPEEFIETVGLQAMLQLKLPLEDKKKEMPFQPMAARSGVPQEAPPPPNIFEELATLEE